MIDEKVVDVIKRWDSTEKFLAGMMFAASSLVSFLILFALTNGLWHLGVWIVSEFTVQHLITIALHAIYFIPMAAIAIFCGYKLTKGITLDEY